MIYTGLFEWDEVKAAKNLFKHGVSFFDAASIFDDPKALNKEDVMHSGSEARLKRLGHSAGKLLLVCFTIRGKKIRIISARTASRQERRDYEKAQRREN